MKEVTGQCRLCLRNGPLRDSHFIPQAAHRIVRGRGKNRDPLVIRSDRALQTSDQTRAHLLCHDCEQRLCKYGEDAFFRNCYRGPGRFRLLDVLRRGHPLVEDGRSAVYGVPESENPVVEQLAYMGVSLFWKSAVRPWKDRDHFIPSITLGSGYQEQMRRFLLGAEPFPEHAALILEVSDERNRLISVVSTPASSKWPTHYLHWIDVCGVRFNLVLGGRMPRRLKELSIFRAGQKRVLVAKEQEGAMLTDYRHLLTVLAQGEGHEEKDG